MNSNTTKSKTFLKKTPRQHAAPTKLAPPPLRRTFHPSPPSSPFSLRSGHQTLHRKAPPATRTEKTSPPLPPFSQRLVERFSLETSAYDTIVLPPSGRWHARGTRTGEQRSAQRTETTQENWSPRLASAFAVKVSRSSRGERETQTDTFRE